MQAVSRSTIGFLIKPLDLDRLLAILEGIGERKQIAEDHLRFMNELEKKNAELEAKIAELESYASRAFDDLEG